MKILAERFRQLRSDYADGAGISLEKIAQRLDVSTKTVTSWERGDVSPQIDNALALAEFFDVSVLYLVGQSDDPRAGLPKRRRPPASSPRVG